MSLFFRNLLHKCQNGVIIMTGGKVIMAFYDWNKDGKKDVQDDFIEYNIYKEYTQDDNSNNHFNNSGCGIWGWIFIALLVIGLVSKCGG